MHLKIDLKLLPADAQPKNSWRYGFHKGDSGVESIYIRKNALPSPPPKEITISIKAGDGE